VSIFSENLVLDAEAVQVARVTRPGIYELGGNTVNVVWQLVSAPSVDGNSPTLAAASNARIYLIHGMQLFARTALGAASGTNLSLWLVWPDDASA
jgi:hypothetical protein